MYTHDTQPLDKGMSLSFSVLGSGSAGNCTLLVLDGPRQPWHVLIDAGLSPRETLRRLRPLGVSGADISEILLTHPDCDHLHPGWRKAARRNGIRWRLSRRHLRPALGAGLAADLAEPFDGTFSLGPRTVVEPLWLPHDELGSVGFLIDHGGIRLGFATDLGRVPETLPQRFAGVSALAIESNYDRSMQMGSHRPAFLKRRIMGGLGHLSNQQALEAVLAVDANSEVDHIVLLHLSRQCNDPRLIRGLFARAAPHLLGKISITSQYQPTGLLHLGSPATTSAYPPTLARQ